jgi:uncharacterized protein YaiI (UPF0178 family)
MARPVRMAPRRPPAALTASRLSGHPASGSLGDAARHLDRIRASVGGCPMLHIFVDADACPVKQEVYRVARRYRLDVTLVANSWMRVPNEGWVALEVVENGFDAADDWIVERVQPDDIVVTADIPLASRCLDRGARVLGPTGKPFTENNIGQAVATRDLLADLRGAGEVTGGPPPLKKSDRSRFLQQLDEAIQAIRREHPFSAI